jgi:hypothetical protein
MANIFDKVEQDKVLKETLGGVVPPPKKETVKETVFDKVAREKAEERRILEESVGGMVAPEVTPEEKLKITEETLGGIVPEPPKKENIFDRAVRNLEDPGIIGGFAEGFGDESSTAILAGGGMTVGERALRQRRQLRFFTRVAKNVGNLLGSAPVFAAGSIGGRFVGGALGTAIAPGPGTAIGAAVGGGAGAFALDAAVKTAYNEYLDLVEERPEFADASFLDVVANVDKSPILIDMVKSGLLGGIVSLNPLMPAIAKIPGVKPLLTSTPGKFMVRATIKNGKIIQPSELTKLGKGVQFGADVATLTTGGAILEQQLPTPEQLVENMLVIGALKISHATASKVIRGAKNTGNFGIFRELDAFTKKDLLRIEQAKTEKTVNKIVNEVMTRQMKANVKPEHRIKATKIVNDRLSYQEQPTAKPIKGRKVVLQKGIQAKEPSLEQSMKAVDKMIALCILSWPLFSHFFPILS